MKKAIELTEQTGTKGIQVQIAGRIDGKEIARVEWIREQTKFYYMIFENTFIGIWTMRKQRCCKHCGWPGLVGNPSSLFRYVGCFSLSILFSPMDGPSLATRSWSESASLDSYPYFSFLCFLLFYL
ncbi:30S ribosomal protein S3, chloroplastic [Dendrobium catenatum]|uniref:30S ribosomal protein S3, chloroplastic n=1 Tax=Dendrobium catenatum TaxID=906689 RepID=A0A2I0VK62_9ASPA|nr:30S ribosomal protein S3, chloroplastic [Dendrobium catenatum]